MSNGCQILRCRWLTGAIAELTELCSEARATARILEERPSWVPLPGMPKAHQMLTRPELMEMLGLKRLCSIRAFLVNLGVKPRGRKTGQSRPFVYRIRDIEKALLKRRADLVILTRPGGKVRTHSPNLFV